MSLNTIAYDTEFLEDGKTIDLISIGMVSADGREYYAVNADCDFERISKHDWLWENVVRYLPTNKENWDDPNFGRGVCWLDRESVYVKPKWVIANEVRDFVLKYTKFDPNPVGKGTTWGGDVKGTLRSDAPPSLWAYYGAYDHVALAQLYGPMIKLPKGIPMFTNDIMQLLEARENADNPVELPPPFPNQHNALADARWNMMVLKAAGVVADYAASSVHQDQCSERG